MKNKFVSAIIKLIVILVIIFISIFAVFIISNAKEDSKTEEKLEEDIKELAEKYKKDAEEAAKKEEEDKKDDSDKDDKTDDTDKKEEEPRDFEQEARDHYEELFKSNNMTKDEYIEEAAKEYRLERFKDYMTSNVSVSDDDIKKKYDELLAAQKLSPDVNADVVVYEPAGVSYKYIKVILTEEEQKEYDKLVDDKDTDGAAKYIKEKSYVVAEKYLERLNKGESFEAVMEDANKYLKEKCGAADDTIKDKDEILKLYKTIGSTGFAGTLDAELTGMDNGDMTGIVDSGKGVYVIAKCYGRFESVTKEYEVGNETYKAIKESLEKSEKETAWDEKLKEIKKSHTVKQYTSRIKKNYWSHLKCVLFVNNSRMLLKLWE